MSTFISDLETIHLTGELTGDRHHANMFMKFRPSTHTPLLYGKTGVCKGIFLYVFFFLFSFPFI